VHLTGGGDAGSLCGALEPDPPDQWEVARIVPDRIESWMNSQQDHPRGALFDGDVEPPKRLVHVTEAGVHRRGLGRPKRRPQDVRL